jgi:hypothetical protein
MSQAPPVDQRIVDEYFQLASQRKTKNELVGFQWGHNNTLLLPNKKRPVHPLHPQWVLLFGLKEKQPCKMQSRWEPLSLSFYRAIAYQDVRLNVTDLLLAYRIRKNYARSFKKQQSEALAFAGAS